MIWIYFFLISISNYLIESHEDLICEPIRGECSDQGYKFTSLSTYNENQFGTQEAADAKIRSYEIMLPCSNYLKIFLCATYKPSCYQEASLIIKPCKSMCEHVFSRCFPVMDKFKKKWNNELNCSRFLDDKSQSCMNDKGYTKDPPLSSIQYIKQIDLLFEKIGTKSFYKKDDSVLKEYSTENESKTNDKSSEFDNEFTLDSEEIYKTSINEDQKQYKGIFEKYICFSQQSEQNIETIYLKNFNKSFMTNNNLNINYKCVLKCDSNILFENEEKKLFRLFSIITNVICFLLSITGIICFKMKKRSNLFPTSNFIFISISILAYSLIQLVYLFIGPSALICQTLDISQMINSDRTFQNPIIALKSYQITLEKPFENGYCSLSALLTYYFRMCIFTGLFFISLSWFILIQFQIDLQKFNKYAKNYLQFVAWILPVFKTVTILVLRNADLSELSGTCSIGNTNSNALLKFLLIPSGVYLAFSFLLNLIGLKTIFYFKFRKLAKKNHLVSTGTTSASSYIINTFNENKKKTITKLKSSELVLDGSLKNLNLYLRDNNLSLIGLLILICTMPIFMLLSCEFYEYSSMNYWKKLPNVIYLNSFLDQSMNLEEIFNSNLINNSHRYNLDSYQKPNIFIFLVKISILFIFSLILFCISILRLNNYNVDESNNSIMSKNQIQKCHNCKCECDKFYHQKCSFQTPMTHLYVQSQNMVYVDEQVDTYNSPHYVDIICASNDKASSPIQDHHYCTPNFLPIQSDSPNKLSSFCNQAHSTLLIANNKKVNPTAKTSISN